MARTHYETLGVAIDASAGQLRTAYRALAVQLHPDRHGGKGDPERFTQVVKAYRVLSDAEQRREYDAKLRVTYAARGRPRSGHFSWASVGGTGSASVQGAQQVQEQTELDEMYEAYFGSQAS